MAYIGREPQLGNFQVCDAISVVNAQAAYTMQVNSVDVSPESVNHMVVSLNGVIQKPGSSYTISSATITFSRNLVTGETIDFIYLLGNVLDLGTPSDDTVTGAKIVDNAINSEHYTDASIDLAHLSADSVDGSKIVDDAINSEHYTDGSIDTAHIAADQITNAKIADDQIDSEHYVDGSIDTAHIADNQITLAKLAGGTDGNIISYDASGDPVAIATGSDGQVLTSTGAGSPPAFEALPGGGLEVADQWRLTTSLDVADAFITANLEQVDTAPQGSLGSAMTQSSGVFTFPSTGFYWVKANAQFSHNGNTRQCQFGIYATADNSNYAALSLQHTYITIGASGNTTTSVVTDTLIDVSNTTNVKVKFWMAGTGGGEDLKGDSAVNATYFTFIKLGAT